MYLESEFRNLARSPDLGLFRIRKLTAPLKDYDRKRRNSDLLGTLRIFSSSNANTSETADKLFLDRNSVLYRLARIEELTGLDLRNSRARLARQLGLLSIESRVRNPNGENEYP